jgi:tetratricopeptide (TPR) repeat protein
MKVYTSGTRIAGRYEVVQGPHEKHSLEGGMGIVYLCLDHQEDRPVALKTFKPEYLPDRVARDRFLREGTHWVDLGAHPHVVRCYRVLHIDPGVYLVLELVAKEEGYPDASLRPWLIPGHPLPVEQALLFALQIARGMGHAAESIPGFVHRDLKPENVLVGTDNLSNADVNRLRVTDFGLAAVLGSASEQIGESTISDTEHALRNTQLTHGIVGTPLYMAPEQWRKEEVTAATDVYALGCMLYEMIVGQHAVGEGSLKALGRAHCSGDLRPLPGDMPTVVKDVLSNCLTLDPGERYADWSIVETALETTFRSVTGQGPPPVEPVAALNRAERVQVGWSYNAMGESYLGIGKAEVATGYFKRAQEAGQTEEERQLEAAGLNNLGLAYLQQGNARRAIGYHEQALEIYGEIRNRHGEGSTLGNLGSACMRLGDIRRAIGYHEQALEIAREIGDWRRAQGALGNLGITYKNLGEIRRAIGYYEQALEIAREIEDRRGESTALGNLGTAYKHLGEARLAIGYHERALEIEREIGDRRGEGQTLTNLGVAYKNLGEDSRAIRYHEQALEIAREIEDHHLEGTALGNLGETYRNLGDARRAIKCFEQVLEVAREMGARRLEGITLGNLGAVYLQIEDARCATRNFEQAMEIAQEVGDVAGIARYSLNMAILYAQQGELGRALLLARQSADIFTNIGHTQYAQHAQQLAIQIQAAVR